jgi:hypothetical protein
MSFPSQPLGGRFSTVGPATTPVSTAIPLVSFIASPSAWRIVLDGRSGDDASLDLDAVGFGLFVHHQVPQPAGGSLWMSGPAVMPVSISMPVVSFCSCI